MRIRRRIERFLLLAGLVGLGVWAWPNVAGPVYQDWQNWVFDREIRGESATAGEYLAEKKWQIEERARVWLGLPPTAEQPAPPSVASSPAPPRKIENNALVGRLTIPRLQLSAIVREGTREGTLSLALGHIPSTALPGQKGNVGVAGHRDTLFRGLQEIRKDDLIRFETPDGSYSYEVKSTAIVSPKDVSVLAASRQSELTLVTCYPFYYVGSAPDRFVVKARQVNERTGMDQKVAHDDSKEVKPARVNDSVDQTESDLGSPGHRLDARKVHFQVGKNHSRQLIPGISLGVSATDATYRRMDGWLWIMPDRRTVWLRSQAAREPLVFYGRSDGVRRELVITNVTDSLVTGYLLLPPPGKAERIPVRRAARVASLH